MIVLTSEIQGIPLHSRGKVRDIYDLGDSLLIVCSDRISAFDSVMPNGVPDKGKVLTHISRFWFRRLAPVVGNHYITIDDDYIAARLAEAGADVTPRLRQQLAGRSMLVVKAEIYPVECVVRGYLAGSLWKEYCEAGGPASAVVVNGIELPAGLRECDQLPEPLFTPSTKATSGHDINIGMKELVEIVGAEAAGRLKSVTLALYESAAALARSRGIIIADTKFEFGTRSGELILADEALSPDSSRFWDAEAYQPGKPQPSFDKQYLRDWLVASGWNKEPPAPHLPADVVDHTAAKYREAFRRVTGSELP